MHHAVDCLVGDLGGELTGSLIERNERQVLKRDLIRRVAQVGGQSSLAAGGGPTVRLDGDGLAHHAAA